MFLLFRLIRESYLFAFQAIVVNKVRTILSLLGITIGIFCIISVFTIFDSMERSIRKSIATLGNNVLYVEKWPWEMGSDYPWWKYYQRPEASNNDLMEIRKRSTLSENSAFMMNLNKTVKFRSNYIENVGIGAISDDFDKVWNFEMASGRYLSNTEINSGKNVAVIGADIETGLFPQGSAIGQKIKIFGRNIEVVGVTKKEGEDFFGNSNDRIVLIPFNYAKTVMNVQDVRSTVIVKARPQVSNDELRGELTGILRAVRKLKPMAENNFAINETSTIAKGFDQLFSVIGTVGWIIGGFSLLVGGFGIANIMFVSVKERTSIIGIQKALGAKNYFIMLQFLFEAVFLSLIGGIFGLLIVFILALLVSAFTTFTLVLTAGNIILGITVSGVIGLVSGILPAWSAAKLDPVEAMRTAI